MAPTATAEALRHSLELIEPLLTDFVPPSGAFDPAGSWAQVYRILPLRLAPKALCGNLKIRRTAQTSGAHFEIEHEVRMMKDYAQWSQAALECAADRWSTPRSFTVQSWTTAPDGQIEADTQAKFSAQVVDAEIRFSGVRKPAVRVAHDWTLDWALFDVVQRLPAEPGGNWQFDLVEDGDLLRPRQRLSCVGPLAATVGGKALELYGFFHMGPGTLPTHYWLDQQHRLLFAIRYYRAFILESGGRPQEKGT